MDGPQEYIETSTHPSNFHPRSEICIALMLQNFKTIALVVFEQIEKFVRGLVKINKYRFCILELTIQQSIFDLK